MLSGNLVFLILQIIEDDSSPSVPTNKRKASHVDAEEPWLEPPKKKVTRIACVAPIASVPCCFVSILFARCSFPSAKSAAAAKPAKSAAAKPAASAKRAAVDEDDEEVGEAKEKNDKVQDDEDVQVYVSIVVVKLVSLTSWLVSVAAVRSP